MKQIDIYYEHAMLELYIKTCHEISHLNYFIDCFVMIYTPLISRGFFFVLEFLRNNKSLKKLKSFYIRRYKKNLLCMQHWMTQDVTINLSFYIHLDCRWASDLYFNYYNQLNFLVYEGNLNPRDFNIQNLKSLVIYIFSHSRAIKHFKYK